MTVGTQKTIAEAVDSAVVGKDDVERPLAVKPLVVSSELLNHNSKSVTGSQKVLNNPVSLTELASETMESSVSSSSACSLVSSKALSVRQLVPVQQESITSTLTTLGFSVPVSGSYNLPVAVSASPGVKVSIPSVMLSQNVLLDDSVLILDQKFTSGNRSEFQRTYEKITAVNMSLSTTAHGVAISEEISQNRVKGAMKMLADNSDTELGTRLIVSSTSMASFPKESFELFGKLVDDTSIHSSSEDSDIVNSRCLTEALPTSEIEIQVPTMNIEISVTPVASDYRDETSYQAASVDMPTEGVTEKTTVGDRSSESASNKT
jgi:hypothetical protein